MFSAIIINCYIPNIKRSEHLILYPICYKNMKVLISECLVKSNKIKVLIINNTETYISLDKGKPPGVLEIAEELLETRKLQTC